MTRLSIDDAGWLQSVDVFRSPNCDARPENTPIRLVVVASMIGAKGLGLEVLLAINRIEVGRGFEAGLCIVFMAIVIDRITFAMASAKKK